MHKQECWRVRSRIRGFTEWPHLGKEAGQQSTGATTLPRASPGDATHPSMAAHHPLKTQETADTSQPSMQEDKPNAPTKWRTSIEDEKLLKAHSSRSPATRCEHLAVAVRRAPARFSNQCGASRLLKRWATCLLPTRSTAAFSTMANNAGACNDNSAPVNSAI